MRLRPPELRVGSIYYLVQYRAASPIVSTYEYKGTADDKPHVHFFQALGLSDANLFLEDAQLKQVVDIAGLKTALKVGHAS
jgi:hypothetical protein